MSTGSEAGSGEAIGVVYLARCAEGAPAFRRFADSYRRQPAGRDHQLIVIYKGFVQRRDRLEARAVFDDLPHLGIELDDSGFDIGAYLEASRRVTHDYLCFLNTYSELAVSGWLAKLADHGLRDGVGIAGAMGSYESLFDSILLMRHARWARDYSLGAADRERVGFYYGMLLDRASGNGDGIADAAPAPPAAGGRTNPALSLVSLEGARPVVARRADHRHPAVSVVSQSASAIERVHHPPRMAAPVRPHPDRRRNRTPTGSRAADMA